MARKRSTRRSKGEGSYWFDKKNSRHVWYIERDGKRYSVAERDEEKARLRFIELKRQLDRNADIEGLARSCKRFCSIISSRNCASLAMRTTAHDARKRADLYILPTLGDMRLCDIKHATVAAWVTAIVNQPNENGKFWAFNSIKQALGLLRRALDSAVPDLLEYNPAARVQCQRADGAMSLKIDREAPQQKTFTQEQIISFLAEVQRTNNALYPLYVLAVKLDLRRGELAGLRWKDVDLETRILFVEQQIVRMDTKTSITTPKSESSIRQIPLAIDLVSMLSEHKSTIEPGSVSMCFPRVMATTASRYADAPFCAHLPASGFRWLQSA